MKIYHLLEGGGGLGTFSLSCFLFSQSNPGGGRSSLLRPWPGLSVLHGIVSFTYQCHATSYSYVRESPFFFTFFLLLSYLVNFRSFPLVTTVPSFICSISHSSAESLLSCLFWAWSFLQEPSPSFNPSLMRTFLLTHSQQAEHITTASILRGGGQDCLLSQKAKHLGCESLTVYLRTQTERTKASRKCSAIAICIWVQFSSALKSLIWIHSTLAALLLQIQYGKYIHSSVTSPPPSPDSWGRGWGGAPTTVEKLYFKWMSFISCLCSPQLYSQ